MDFINFQEADLSNLINILDNDQSSYERVMTEKHFYFQKFAYQSPTNEILLARVDPLKQIIIERIMVAHKHQGVGTKLIHEVENIANKYEYKTILIQSILTPEMWNLSNKLGYTKTAFDAVKELQN